MVFSNLTFLYVFLPLLFLLYYPVPSDKWRRGILCAFSLLFYAWGEPVCILILLSLVAADYGFGRAVAGQTEPHLKKALLVLAIVVNLGTLAVFKYIPFFLKTCNSLLSLDIPIPSIALPIGISFFTFQTMSYVIDVYRGDAAVQKSFFRLLLYVSFFPQLIAGPIVRYKDIEEQLESRRVDTEAVNDGLFRFAVGLAKKVLIADVCDGAVTALYGLEEMTLLSRWGGALFFTLQLYYDFSAYSDMAIGLGRMFGFTFSENFRYPLASSTVTEFWRRWHISLGTFFRDYVYIPLGGNRHLQMRNILIVWFLPLGGNRHLQMRNILIVWFLTGLWHGASWNFVLWGLYYAVLLVLEKLVLLKAFKKLPSCAAAPLTHIYTVLITVFGFAIFYFDTDLLRNLSPFFGVGLQGITDIYTNAVFAENLFLLLTAAVFAMPVFPYLWDRTAGKLPYPVQRILMTVLTLVLIGVSTVRMAGNTYSPFLYFRF